MPIRKTHIDRTSLNLCIDQLGTHGEANVDMRLAYKAAIKGGGEMWLRIATESLSATDHSLKDLARMDHPYARRHGSVQVHQGWSIHLDDTTNLVHTRDGRLVRAIRSSFDPGLGPKDPVFRVSLDPSEPLVRFVLKGTRTMLPRDPLASAAYAPQTQADIMAAVTSRLQRRFGPHVVPRFT